MKLRLVRPTFEYESQVMMFKKEMLANGDSLAGCAGLQEVDTFSEWLKFDERHKRKYGEGNYAHSEVFLAVRNEDNKVVGIIDYRHPMTEFLTNFGGTIGYSIIPSERRKGYASEMLSLLLKICKEYGEENVLITCDKKNVGSRKTILKNGGIFENEVPFTEVSGKNILLQRYWIKL